MELGLCPFVKPFFMNGQIQYLVSEATSPEDLLVDLCKELAALVAVDPAVTETVLLIHPHVLGEFLDYNDFLDIADAALVDLDLDGEIQIASFHPHYQFADTGPGAIENYTNRSPYPMLHLLRESSIALARATYADIEGIPGRNIATLRNLSPEAQQRLRDSSL